MRDRWGSGPPAGADPVDELVFLSNLVGLDSRLVQPGGGNSSLKLSEGGETTLLVKGSGTDLRTIERGGFTRLSSPRLEPLREADNLGDDEMMRLMRASMLAPDQDPLPSVETPLHASLPQTVVLHTHDVATMSITNVEDATAASLLRTLFGEAVAYAPYARPGFPLARAVEALAVEIPTAAKGLALAHHGLVVWGDDARQCYERLLEIVNRIEEFLAERREARSVLGAPVAAALTAERRREMATWLLPIIRGELGRDERVITHFDDSPEVLRWLASERTRELSQRGMVTPEHILRAGRLPLWLDLDFAATQDQLAGVARSQIAAARDEYAAYHTRNAHVNEEPIADWAKVVLVPGLGMVTAFRDKRSAITANVCYRTGMETIENAEAAAGFRFLEEADVFEFEHWPLERRKVEETIAHERKDLLLAGHVAIVVGGASGIGAASARRFAEEGASVVIADIDEAGANGVAKALAVRFPGQIVAHTVDVRDEVSVAALVERGRARGACRARVRGLDCLFYSAGLAPRFAPLLEIEREDLQQQLDVHYLGALSAIREAGRVMARQGLGGSIVCSVSKAALSAGREAVAYGGAKAALLQALRVAALELGAHGIRVNAVNADHVDTPLFHRFVEERAQRRGVSVEQQLERYRDRNALGVSLIPPAAVAEVAVALASERFRYTTGDILTVDGGLPDAFPR